MMTQLMVPHGSTNALKNAAWREAFAKSDMDVQVIPYEVPSGIDDQPFGGSMGDLGAENRACGALARCDSPIMYGLGTESYFEFRRGLWLDFASCVIVKRSPVPGAKPDLVAIATSVGIPCPQEYVLRALAKGAGRRTAGEEFAAAVHGVDKADWHKAVTKGRFSRRYLIVDACVAAISQVEW
jgi:non-canonical (house-cleaning) NTP pyrophosphatase